MALAEVVLGYDVMVDLLVSEDLVELEVCLWVDEWPVGVADADALLG